MPRRRIPLAASLLPFALTSAACSDSVDYVGLPAGLEGSQNDLVVFAQRGDQLEVLAVEAGAFPSLTAREGSPITLTLAELDGSLRTYRISHAGVMKIAEQDGEPLAQPLRLWSRRIVDTERGEWALEASSSVLETEFALCPLSTEDACIDPFCPDDTYALEGRCLPCGEDRPFVSRGECVASCRPGETLEGKVCRFAPAVCGDGILGGSECDDGNRMSADGCSDLCQVEPGYACVGSVCTLTCGNGISDAAEGCDDGNRMSADGCSVACIVEAGWICDDAMPSVCRLSTWRNFGMLSRNNLGAELIHAGPNLVLWGGRASNVTPFEQGGRYVIETDQWLGMSTVSAPDVTTARTRHSMVWTGVEVIVWGGVGLNSVAYGDGGRYNPALDQWVATSSVQAPSARFSHSGVWTGSEMIVWGGVAPMGTGMRRDGGRYDPVTDRWTPTSLVGAPSPRAGHVAVWTGTEMLVWGGYQPGGDWVSDGGRYDPATDTWSSIPSFPGAPLEWPRGFWAGSELLVGGIGDVAYYRYDSALDSWRAASSVGAIPFAAGAWDGSSLLVYSPGEFASYSPSTDSWTALEAPGSTSARATAIWTGSEMILFTFDGARGQIYAP